MHSAESQQVVLIHCSAGSPRQWSSLTASLTGFETKALDLIGHAAQNHWYGEGPLSLTAEAAAIAAACPNGAPFHLIGHSYGGAVALRFALSFPERVRSLSLIEPTSFHILKKYDGGDALLSEVREVVDAVNCGVITGDYRSGMATFIDYWNSADNWKKLPDIHKERFSQLALHVAHHFQALFEERATLADYATIAAPTLILSGTRSPRPARTIARLLATALPQARHRTIGGAGHMAPLTHAAAVNCIIVSHIQAHAASEKPDMSQSGPACAA